MPAYGDRRSSCRVLPCQLPSLCRTAVAHGKDRRNMAHMRSDSPSCGFLHMSRCRVNAEPRGAIPLDSPIPARRVNAQNSRLDRDSGSRPAGVQPVDAVRGVPEVHGRIQSVQQLDDTHVQWVAEIRGESRQWTTEITDQRPDEKVAWKTIDGEVKNDGVVTFEQVGDNQTRVNVEMEVESDSTTENVAGDLLGTVKDQVHGDLERFKQLIENRDEETGAWRGEVQDSETK